MWIAKTTCRPWTLLLLSLALSTFDNSLVDAKHKHVHHRRRLTKKSSEKARKEQAPTTQMSKGSKLVASVGKNIAPAPVGMLLPVVPTPVPSMTSRQPVVRPPTTPPRRSGGGGGGGAVPVPAAGPTTVTLDFDNPVGVTSTLTYEGFTFTGTGGIADCTVGCTDVPVNTRLMLGSGAITMTQTNGNTFSLNSFQFVDNANFLTSFRLLGTDSAGNLILPPQGVALANSGNFETVTPNPAFSNVLAVTFSPGGLPLSLVNLDNLSVTY